MNHKILKSKGLSLFGQATRQVVYGTHVEATELGPDARLVETYYVDFHYERSNGHTYAEIYTIDDNIHTHYLAIWHLDLPLGWIPTEGQLVQLAEEAVKKYLMGHLKKIGYEL